MRIAFETKQRNKMATTPPSSSSPFAIPNAGGLLNRDADQAMPTQSGIQPSAGLQFEFC